MNKGNEMKPSPELKALRFIMTFRKFSRYCLHRHKYRVPLTRHKYCCTQWPTTELIGKNRTVSCRKQDCPVLKTCEII